MKVGTKLLAEAIAPTIITSYLIAGLINIKLKIIISIVVETFETPSHYSV